MPDGNNDHQRQLLNDEDVASLVRFSPSWVRQQRFKRNHGQDHIFDVESIPLGSSPRYLETEVNAWILRRAACRTQAILGDPQHKGGEQEESPFDLAGATKVDVVPASERSPTRHHRRMMPSFAGCRFIEGDPLIDPTNCGKQQEPGSSYCAEHHAKCWVPAKETP
jgi:hypothetical protein